MKNQHLLLPLALVVAAVVVGTATIGVGLSGSKAPTIAEVPNNQSIEIAHISVTADQSAAAAQTRARVINWSSTNYTTNSTVNINLLKKVSDNPHSYEFIRTIAANTPNDGSESWIPKSTESGDTYYIEVVCGGPLTSSGCRSTTAPLQAF